MWLVMEFADLGFLFARSFYCQLASAWRCYDCVFPPLFYLLCLLDTGTENGKGNGMDMRL